MAGFLWWPPVRGVRLGPCVLKVFVSVFFLRQMTCVMRVIRFLIRKRSTCWLCCVSIKNSYNTCVKSTPSWAVRLSTEHWYRWSFGYESYTRPHFVLWKRKFWWTVKESLFLESNLKLWRHLSSPSSVYGPGFRRCVTVGTVNEIWVGGYVTVTFHMWSIQKHWF